jgi:Type II secretion system (T2SS), protein E, N-terminal domain
MSHELEALLVEHRLLTRQQVKHAAQVTRGTGCTWVEKLFIDGVLDEDRVAQCISSAFCVPQTDLRKLANVPPEIIATLPAQVALEHRVVPIAIEGDGYLRVAMLDPMDSMAVAEVAFFSGLTPLREVTRASAIAWALDVYYPIGQTMVRDVLWPRPRPLAELAL